MWCHTYLSFCNFIKFISGYTAFFFTICILYCTYFFTSCIQEVTTSTMSGFLPRIFGKSQHQGETRRRMNEMEDLKTNQHIAKLESELKASKAKVEELQGKLEAMKIVLEKKDTALDDVTRDREKVANALKNEDMCSKYMKEQLEKGLKNLEREKQRFLIEKSNFQTKKDLMLGQITIKDPEKYPQTLEDCTREISRLQKYTQTLQSKLLEREKTIATLCEKFLLLKFKRTQSVAQLKSLKEEFDEISRDLLKKLQEARNEINMLADTKYQDPMDKKNYALVQMVQKNGELILENSTLKLEISQLKQSVSSLKLEHSIVDINTRTLEMRSVPSSYTLRTQERRTPFKYSTRSSDITNSQTSTYQRSLNTDNNMPTMTCTSCMSPRSAPSSILTYKPKRGKIPLYVTQENDGGTSRNQETASERKECPPKSHKTHKDPQDELGEHHNKLDRRKVKQTSHSVHDKRRHSRRKREMRQYTSDSSARESITVSRQSEVTNIPSQLLAELHPKIAVCNSKETVDREKCSRRGRQRRKVKSVRYEEKEPSTVSSKQEGIKVKEDESLESIYSTCYLSPTRSTPGRVETTAFLQDQVANSEPVPSNAVSERPKSVNTKCN